MRQRLTDPHNDAETYRLKKLGVRSQADRDADNRLRDRAFRDTFDEVRDESLNVGGPFRAIDFVGVGVAVTRKGEVITVTVDPTAWLLTSNLAQDNADNATNASTTVYATAMSTAITLPAGTWTIQAIGSINARNDTAATTQVRVQIDGTAGTATSTTNGIIAAPNWARLAASSVKTGVASGSRTVLVEYKVGTASTATANNPTLQIIATRTA